MFTSAFRMAVTASFDPRSLTPILWYDGADSATMWDATSGGSLVANNGTIARWEDKSGNSYHLTQATSGERPTRKAATLNSRDVVGFSGTNEINTAGNVAWADALGVTVFTVFKSISTALSMVCESAPNNDFANAFFMASQTNNKFQNCHQAAGFYPNSIETTGSTNVYHIWSATHDITAANEAVFLRDGNARAATITSPNTSAGIVTSRFFVGRRSQSSMFPLTGEIAEILIYRRVLTIDQRQAVERYLSAKWAISLA